MTESLGWTETFPLLYLWSCLQRRLRQATSYSKLLQITWSDLMLDWCLRQSTSHRVSVVYHSYGGMVDMTKASDKSGVNKLFWNVMVGITRSKVICFFVCCPKVLPHFPIPTTVLTAKETAYLALVDVQTLPIKTVKNTPQKAPFGWEWLPACLHFFGPTCHLRWKRGNQQVKTVGECLLDMARVDFKPSIQK